MLYHLLAQVNIGQEVKLNTDPNSGVANTYTDFASLISLLVKNAITVAGIIFVILLILGGFNFIVSAGSGDTKKTQQASQTITAALIGFVVIFLSYAIVQLIQLITGLQIL